MFTNRIFTFKKKLIEAQTGKDRFPTPKPRYAREKLLYQCCSLKPHSISPYKAT